MNRYEVHQLFAHGAQARLFRATDVVTGERCLLKVGEASHQEAFLALDLNHPFIQPPIDIGILPAIGRFAAYRECADPPFLTWLQRRPKDEDFLRVILQMTEFLSFLHHRGFLYNDFKPDHFLIGQEEIKVVDLGLCVRIRENVTSERFSGTFPYISPERLTGKPSDERSDIFAFGMMLLHSFSPDEAWNFSPSTSVLENLVETHTRLGPPWSRIISEMTAFEPSQRIGSAAELWERLLPAGAKKAFLFFPVSSSFSLPSDPLENPVTIIRSSSPISLVEAKTKILSHAWLKGITVFSIDFRATSPEDFFRMLCICVTGHSSPHLMAAIDELQKNENPTLVVFSSEEILDPSQRALLHLAMTSLSRNNCMRFVLMSSNNKSEGLPEEFHTVTLPPLRRQDIDQLGKQLFPEGSSLLQKTPNLLPRSASSPEQIFRELKRQLPVRFFSLWPAIARHSPQGTILDRLGPSERKLLLALAIAGGSIKRETLELFFPKKLKETILILNHLENEGALHIGDPEIVTLIPAGEILRRYRKSQIRSIADNLLAKLPHQADLKTLYYLALHSENKRRAAAAALRLFRLLKARKLHEDAFRWLWSAFLHHSDIPTNLLYGISKYLLRTAQMSKVRKVLSTLYKRNGPSLRLVDFYIDYFHRLDLLERAGNLSARALSEANKRHNQKRSDYFAVRLAGLLILQQKLEEGEKLLEGMQGKDLDPKTQGLVHHFSGLAFFFRGKITNSINENLKAIQFRHRFRSSSLMNLGIGYGQIRDWENARKYLEKSIRIFTLQYDVNRLSHACTNLANVLKETGQLKEARYNHYRSMYYARTSKHLRNYIVALENLAITYELEGKTNRSISLHLKSTRLSKAAKFSGLMAQSLTNLGLQYAYQGRIALGLNSVRKAIVLKKPTGNKISLANSYEYLGLVHALAGHYSKAQRYLKISEDYFSRGACLPDGFRVRTYRAIFLLERSNAAEARKLLKPAQNSDLALLNRGLSHFAWALFYLRSERFLASACRKHLHEGERVLRKAPSLFWLAKLLKLKADYFIKTDHPEKAVLSLQSAYHIFSKLGARKELNDFSQWGTKMEMPENFMNQMAEKLPYKVLLMIQEILSLEEPDAMISAILTAAMEFADMERAVLILNEDPPRIFKSASMDESTVEEIRQISTTALDSASDSEKPFYCFDVGSNAYFKDKASILNQHILSIVCLPLKTNHKNLGVLYLDSREGVETVAKTEMVLLEIFASIISIVLDNAILFEHQITARGFQKDSSNFSKEFPEIMGNSKETNQLMRSVHKLLESTLPVLITGETGTGKELVARVLHYGGARKNGPFVAVNSSAFSPELLESELFGHEQGAFTGAIRTKKGLFEEAQSGTIFLDEIGEMPISMQSKLLRILQDGEFRRVGGTVTLKTNARVVLATHRELEKMMEQGKFRADLYYRISGVQLIVPALRERRSDIPVLATAFLQKASQTMHKHILGFSPEAMELLKRYSWPGNVRQLKMEIERIVAFSEEDWISPESLDLQIRQPSKSIEVLPKDKSSSLQEIEKEAILDRLFEFDWNVIQAAKSLGLSRHGLYSKMKRFQIPRSRPQQSIQ